MSSEDQAKKKQDQASNKVPQTLYEVLDAACSIKQIQSLLQLYKDRGAAHIRIGGATKSDVVKNVKEAVAASAIPESAVFDLIRDHEESGNQHIFYYRPKNAAAVAHVSDGKRIGQKLLGARLRDGSLPNYQTTEGEYVWADFRTSEVDAKWTAKIYGHQTRIQYRRQEKVKGGVIRYYDVQEKRVVCLAHWDGRFFELRIGRVGTGSSDEDPGMILKGREIDRRMNTLQEFIAPAGLMSEVEPWDLSRAQRTMLVKVLEERDLQRDAELEEGEEPTKSELSFVPSSVKFRDSGFGTAEFNAHDDGEDVVTVEERTEAIRGYLNGPNSNCRQLVVQWDPDSANGIWGEKPLRTIIGGGAGNEITIASVVNSRTVDYVTNQLYRFSR